jgi:hypothetical protein
MTGRVISEGRDTAPSPAATFSIAVFDSVVGITIAACIRP